MYRCIVRRVGADSCRGRVRSVLLLSEDASAAGELGRRLPGACFRVVSVDAARPPDMHSADFLIAAAWLLAECALVIANSRSNFGTVIFALAGRQRVPAVVDMDGSWGTSSMLRGTFPCRMEWGSRSYHGGLCNSW